MLKKEEIKMNNKRFGAILIIVSLLIIFVSIVVLSMIKVNYSGGFSVELRDIDYVNINEVSGINLSCPGEFAPEFCPLPNTIIISGNIDMPLTANMLSIILREIK